MQKKPVLHICDDACTLVCHSLQRYPVESELAYGSTRGCFENPHEDIPPKRMSCPDIIPIELDNRMPNRDAMKNPSTLVHPDVSSTVRYVLGTRCDNTKLYYILKLYLNSNSILPSPQKQ